MNIYEIKGINKEEYEKYLFNSIDKKIINENIDNINFLNEIDNKQIKF